MSPGPGYRKSCLLRPYSDFCPFLQELLSEEKPACHLLSLKTLCDLIQLCGKLFLRTLLAHSLPRSSTQNMSPGPHSCVWPRGHTGLPAHLPLCPMPLPCALGTAGSSVPLPGAPLARCSSPTALLAALTAPLGVLEEETHLRAIQEQQVPAFLVKEGKKPNKPASEQSWGSSAVAVFVSVHGRGNTGVLQPLQNALLVKQCL